MASGTNNHANVGTGNETYTETVNVTIPAASTPGTYTITIQTLHSLQGTQGCSFVINNTCRRQATVTFTIPATASDMSVDLSGLPTTADLNQPYTGSFTCTNDALAPVAANAASCSAAGLPAGINVTSCTPSPPATIAPGNTITCNVSGAPTATGTSTVTGTTGATNDIDPANDSATTSITVTSADMSPDLSGLPTNTIVGTPYAGSFTCDNAGPNTAVSATCSVTGLPAGVVVTGCVPSPPTSVASGSGIVCSVSGTPTATTTANVTVTTGAGNDSNGGTGTGGNNQASVSITATAIETNKSVVSVSAGLGNSTTLVDAGDEVTYTITVQNTGTSTLTGVNVSDALTRLGGGGLALTSGPTFVPGGGSPEGTLVSGETATYTAAYTFVQADIDAGGVSNIATGQGTSPGGSANDVTDPSSAVVTNIVPSPVLTITKEADDDTLRAVNDIITYTYIVTNTGNVTINGVTISDVHNGSGPAPVPTNETLFNDAPPLSNSTDAGINASWDSLAPGDSVRFTASYTVTQSDIDLLQ